MFRALGFWLGLIWLKHLEGTFQGRQFKLVNANNSDRVVVQQRGCQPSLQAAMKVAECRREMAVAAQAGRQPVLASQTQTGSELGEYGL